MTCEYSIYRLNCMVCDYESEYGKKEIIIVSDSVKSITVCKRCFVKTLKDFTIGEGEKIRTEFKVFKNDFDETMTFERFVRFYYIDYVLELFKRPKINLYI